MDKGRITYRFERAESRDGQKPISAGKPPVPEHGTVIPLFPEDLDGFRRYVPERSVSDRSAREEEADRIERLILQSGTAAGRSAVRDDFPENGFEGADAGGEPNSDAVVYRRVHRRGRKGWPTLLMSGLGAILTGVLLGSFVLHFFRGDPSPAVLPSVGAGNGETETSGAPGQEWTAVEQPEGLLPLHGMADPDAGTEGQWFRLPEKTYYVVQNGVFSSRDGADAAANLLRDKGYAGAVEDGEKLAVYAGMADDRDDALLIARQLEAERMDIFIKPVVLPALDVPAGVLPDAEALAAYFAESRELMDLVMDMSLRHLNEASPGALSESERQNLKEAHRRWTEAANGLPEPAEAEAQSAIQAINRAASSAVAAMEQYAKTPSAAYLWQAQTALLDHLIAQKRALDIITPEGKPEAGTAAPAGQPA